MEHAQQGHVNECRMPHLEICLPVTAEVCYDGLAAVTDTLIAAKCVEDGRILIFSFQQALLKKPYGTLLFLCFTTSTSSIYTENNFMPWRN